MIILEPFWPWSYIAAAAALGVVFSFLLRGLYDYLNKTTLWLLLGGSKFTRYSVLSLSLVAATFFAVAAFNPIWTTKPNTATFHVQVVVDVSESVLRAEGGWENIRQSCYEKINASLAATPSSIQRKCTAGITTFRDNTFEALVQKPLKDLPESFIKLDKNSFAGGNGTDIEKALNSAAHAISDTNSQGLILLISDGNQTSGQALQAVVPIASQGISLQVLPITSRSPAIAITDADLPRLTHVNTQTFLRGLLLNHLPARQNATLSFGTFSQPVTLPTDVWVRFRWPVLFQSFGLHYYDVSLTPYHQKQAHNRRFFTYALCPPKILAIGGDNRWIGAVPNDSAEIIPIPPDTPLLSEDVKEIDAIVISGVPAHTLSLQTMITIKQCVENEGKGLLLINGSHSGASAETETVIMSYNKTPLESVLPVVGGPRPFTDEPPPRQVAILIDTSGSMEGWKLTKSRQIAKYIVQYLLRPKDRLDLISFTTGAGQLLRDREMDDEGKQAALTSIDSITGGGGTDPNRALEMIGSREMSQCGLIFISDGEFGYIKYRPDCRVTVFEIGGTASSPALKQLADPIPVPPDFDPKAITIPYFEPENRNKFYETDSFTPLSMAQHLPKHLRLPVPEMELPGSAVSYLQEGGILIGVRPKLTDPVLAFKQVGTAYCGYFASSLSGRWLEQTEGKAAITAWLARIIPFMERDRYYFEIEDFGDSLEIRISLNPKNGKIPNVSGMTALIQFPGQEFTGVPFSADPSMPGTFYGEIRVERKEIPRQAFLILRESGSEALTKEQRVPLMIPPQGSIQAAPTTEAYTYGQNRPLLRQLAEKSGGLFNPPKGTPFFKDNPNPDHGTPLWPLLSVIAIFAYLGAITLKRWNP